MALRAIKFLDDSQVENARSLIELLSYYLSDVWDGCWLPDTLINDMNYGHIFKMEGDTKINAGITAKTHRIKNYDELKKQTMGRRLCLEEYLKDSEDLNNPYWVTEPQLGHLPDRVIAINHSIIDMLKMGDYPLAFYLRNVKPDEYLDELTEKNVKSLSLSPNYSARQVALSFFVVSHYICDAHMPLHCDLRDASKSKGKLTYERRLPKAIHPGIESEWERNLPTKSHLTINKYTENSIKKIVSKLPKGSFLKLDEEDSSYKLNPALYKNMPNEWDEMVNICRISYAVSRKWIPYKPCQIEEKIGKEKCSDEWKELNHDDVMSVIGEDEFKDVSNRIFHDAVASVARIWYRAWRVYTYKT